VNRIITKGIVLSRTDYAEADRIVTMLTPDHGKLRLMARGVRKIKSKLAGGIELFSVSDITYMEGRGEIGTLISCRLETHFGKIVKDIDRVQLGYELTKLLNKATEDHTEAEYFDLMEQALEALNDSTINLDLIRAWFNARLLKLAGHSPNLKTDAAGAELAAAAKYNFDFEDVAFVPHPDGRLTADHIKILRLLFSGHSLQKINRVSGLQALITDCSSLILNMVRTHLRT